MASASEYRPSQRAQREALQSIAALASQAWSNGVIKRAARSELANLCAVMRPADRPNLEELEALLAQPGFAPQALANSILVLDAAQGVTVGGGVVTSWADLSPSGLSAVSGAGNEPTLTAASAAYNNQPVVVAAVATKTMVTGAAVHAQELTMIVVGESSTNTGILLGGGNPAGPTAHIMNNANNLRINAGANLGDAAITAPCAMFGYFNGVTSLAGVNDWVAGGTAGNAGAGGTTLFSLFSDHVGAANTAGEIALVAIYSRALTAAEKIAFAGYIQSRFNITVT